MQKPVYVYVLKRGDEVLYIGESINPDLRYKQHVNWKPQSAVGKFYGQTDIVMEIDSQYETKKEAYDRQTQLQLRHNLPTDGQKNRDTLE